MSRVYISTWSYKGILILSQLSEATETIGNDSALATWPTKTAKLASFTHQENFPILQFQSVLTKFWADILINLFITF